MNRIESLKFYDKDHILLCKIIDREKENKPLDPNMVECSCGCGKLRPKYGKNGVRLRRIFGHAPKTSDSRMQELNKLRKVQIQCRCGCGEYISLLDEKNNRKRFFKYGHQDYMAEKKPIPDRLNKEIKDPLRMKHSILKVLYGYLLKNGCKYARTNICVGKLFITSNSKDLNNYDIEDIEILCATHTQLKSCHPDIDLNTITESSFYTDVKGKRRYVYLK